MADQIIFTAAQFADAMGVSSPTVSMWSDDGMPVLDRPGRGKPMSIDVWPAVRWVIDNRTKPGSERERLARAQADKFELENAKRRGVLVELSYVSQWAMGLITSANGMLDGLPGRCAAEMVGMSAAQIRARLLDETRAVRAGMAEHIQQLADTPPADEDAGEDGATSAPQKRKRMGRRKPGVTTRKRGAGPVEK